LQIVARTIFFFLKSMDDERNKDRMDLRG